MNLDIRLAVSFKGHRKRERLNMILGKDGTGYLIDLWITTSQDNPEGILTGWDALDIAIAAGWKGEPRTLVDALIKSGWLDYDEKKKEYSLHDWQEHQIYACGARKRREAAIKAANLRWNKSEKEAMRLQCDRNATALKPTHSLGLEATKNICDHDATAMPQPTNQHNQPTNEKNQPTNMPFSEKQNTDSGITDNTNGNDAAVNDALFKSLSLYAVDNAACLKLIKSYTPDRIVEKILFLNFYNDNEPNHIKKQPAYLVDSIKEDYDKPAGFAEWFKLKLPTFLNGKTIAPIKEIIKNMAGNYND